MARERQRESEAEVSLSSHPLILRKEKKGGTEFHYDIPYEIEGC